MSMLARFASDESGASAIEYGLLVALVAFGMLASLRSLGPSLSGMFFRVATTLAGF
ncbi:MAG: Flp family type IVb pilin [Alphaproteobacteria bacterium]|nr:Flp family type IVb pilin [Alphaproteobacteria bacterium]